MLVKASANRTQGFVLLPVVLALTLIAAVSLLLNRGGAMNMSLAARGLQADAARYVAEAGLAHLNFQTQGRNCSGFTDLGTTTIGAHTFTATVNPKSGTPVALSATATTADGARATLTRNNVTVYQTTLQSVVLQPRAALDDAWLKGTSSANFGADTELNVKATDYRSLVRFDLTSIPAGSMVTSAQMMLYQTAGGSVVGETITASPLVRAWAEGVENNKVPVAAGVTWSSSDGTTPWTTPGGDFNGSLGVSSVYSATIGWKTWNITSIAQSWISGAYPNYGLILTPSPAVPNTRFVSGDDTSQPGNTPKLMISFFPPCGWVPPPSVVTLNPIADAALNSSSPTINYGASTQIGLAGPPTTQGRMIASFSTSGIAPGTSIQSAILRVFVGSTSNAKNAAKTVQVFRLTEAWLEGTKSGSGGADGATWNRKNSTQNWVTAGGTYAATAAGTTVLASTFTSGWITVNITGLAIEWIDGVSPNFGLLVTLSSDETFNTNTRENATNRPELVITF